MPNQERKTKTTWETPQAFFDMLNAEFGFTLDVCALPGTAKCEKYFTPEDNGLVQDWTGEVFWMNPPYGRGQDVYSWVKKAFDTAQAGGAGVCLLPASIDTKWFHDFCMKAKEIRFIKDRLWFSLNGQSQRANHGSIVVIFDPVPVSTPKLSSITNARKKTQSEAAGQRGLSILDACCGSRMFWFDHQDSRVVFVDKRRETYTLPDKSSKGGSRILNLNPDLQADFTALPFPNNSFALVVFDPPHLQTAGKKSRMAKKYGKLEGDWREELRKGFAECFRVLRPEGTLIFKWNECQIPVSQILALTPERPLFGNQRSKLSKTHWIVFMKDRADE